MPNHSPESLPSGFFAIGSSPPCGSALSPRPAGASTAQSTSVIGNFGQSRQPAAYQLPHGVYSTTRPPQPQTFGRSAPSYHQRPQSRIHNPNHQYPHQSHLPLAHVQQRQLQQQRQHEEEWKCKACNHELASKAALDAHTKTHTKCSVCNFSAAPKIVKAHYQAAHGKFSGAGFKSVTVAVPGCPVQRFRICVGNRPEDIQRWIADRKRRFPRSKSIQYSQRSGAKSSADTKESRRGLSNLLDGYGSSSSSDDDADKNETERRNKRAKISGRDEERGTATEEKTVDPVASRAAAASIVDSHSTKYRTRPCRYFVRNGTCRYGDSCTFSHDISEQPMRNSSKCKRPGRSNRSGDRTLLQKLLSNDVEREAALALQLIDYIVENDFLSQRTEDTERLESSDENLSDDGSTGSF